MVVFISQPMSGKSDAEILTVREEVKAIIREKYGDNVFIIDSFIKSNKSPVYMLGTAISLMSSADVVFFAKGWEHSRGCKIEHQVAESYGIECVEV